ncbi:MAG: DinB family protein [Bacteroidetes bacterium]|nr:DinB family protein [Bacteroidota bacterium]
MQLRDLFLRTYDFNTRANERIIDALRTAGHPVDEAVGLLGHMLQAEKLWFLRLEGFDSGAVPVWPAMTLNECENLARITADAARAYIRHLDDEDFEHRIHYRTSKGDVFENTVADILTHLSHHGAYHRAQINRILREHGDAPAVVDFIAFARS